MKKLLSVLLILAMVFCFAGCGSNESAAEQGGETAEEAIVLTIGNVAVGEDQPYNHVLQYTNQKLAENGSNISLDIQDAGVLGGEVQLVEQTIAGTIPMCQIADMSLTSFIPEANFLTFPGIMSNYDDVKAEYVNGWIYEKLNALCEAKGLVLLGVSDNGFRWITNSKHPVEKPEDIEGLLVRVPENEVLLDFWGRMGAQTTPIAWGELATALQQGVVDGQEVCPMTFAAYNFDEFNQYGTQINYCYSGVITLMNKAQFDAMSAEDQAELKEACEYGNAKMMEEAIASGDQTMQDMIDRGFTLTEPSQELLDKIAQVGNDMANSEKWKAVLGQDLIDQMYN